MSNIESFDKPFTSNKPYLFEAIYQWILDNDGTPYLVIDTRHAEVEVPWQHVQNDQITLNVSPEAITNWHSDHQAISFNARFSGKSQTIYIPFNSLSAVYAQENGLGMSFPEELITEELITEEDATEEKIENLTRLNHSADKGQNKKIQIALKQSQSKKSNFDKSTSKKNINESENKEKVSKEKAKKAGFLKVVK